VQLVAAETDHEQCFDEDVVTALEQKLKECNKDGVNIRALLIVNPHNPLGPYHRNLLFRHQRVVAKKEQRPMLLQTHPPRASLFLRQTLPTHHLGRNLRAFSIPQHPVSRRGAIHVPPLTGYKSHH